MRNLSDNVVKEPNNNSSCYYNDHILSFILEVVYRYNIIIVLISINLVIFSCIFLFIINLVNKKAMVYKHDDYQTSVTIHHVV